MIVEHSDLILPSIKAELEIPFIGDLHIGARACHEARMEHDFELISHRLNTYPLITGDSVDAIVPKDSRRFSPGAVAPWVWNPKWAENEQFPLEAVISRQQHRAIQIFKNLPCDRVLGIMEGNHETAYMKFHSSDVTHGIAKEFNWKMLGFSTFLTLTIGFLDSPITVKIRIYAHHGWGGGSRTEGYNLTKYSRQLPYFDADIYAFSHVHDIQTKVIPFLAPVERDKWKDLLHSNERIKFNDRALIVTGTYLRTLSDGRFPTYSEEKGYPPRKLGYASALVSFNAETGETQIGYAVR